MKIYVIEQLLEVKLQPRRSLALNVTQTATLKHSIFLSSYIIVAIENLVAAASRDLNLRPK